MRTIRIRQLSLEDARLILENELNEAFMSGEKRVSVLHGIGTGKLKNLTAEVARELGFAHPVPETFIRSNPGITQLDLDSPDLSNIRRYRRGF